MTRGLVRWLVLQAMFALWAGGVVASAAQDASPPAIPVVPIPAAVSLSQQYAGGSVAPAAGGAASQTPADFKVPNDVFLGYSIAGQHSGSYPTGWVAAISEVGTGTEPKAAASGTKASPGYWFHTVTEFSGEYNKIGLPDTEVEQRYCFLNGPRFSVVSANQRAEVFFEELLGAEWLRAGTGGSSFHPVFANAIVVGVNLRAGGLGMVTFGLDYRGAKGDKDLGGLRFVTGLSVR